MSALLVCDKVVKHYTDSDGCGVRAVDGVSFTLGSGEILGIVGESGCGKSTLGRALMRLTTIDSGGIQLNGIDFANCNRRELKRHRADIQMVFQDPFGSLNPRHRVATIIGEPLVVHGRPDVAARVNELLDLVGLPRSAARRLPHQFSGGQRQRIAIARALALSPKVLIADEAVSALDVSIQSQIINLLADLRREFDLSMIFISHDLSVVRHLSDTIAVMYLGRFVETGPAADVFARPRHPYTRALISAIPLAPGATMEKRRRIILSGDVPDPSRVVEGCAFHPRCPDVVSVCRANVPALVARFDTTGEARDCACHLGGEVGSL